MTRDMAPCGSRGPHRQTCFVEPRSRVVMPPGCVSLLTGPESVSRRGPVLFPHPAGGTKTLEAPIPPDMAGLIAALGLG